MRYLALVGLLTACTPIAKEPRFEPVPFKLDKNGIQLLDRDQRIDFGRTDHSTVPAMSKLVGQPPNSTLTCESGGEIVLWPDGTGLVMKRGAFQGWVSKTRGETFGAACNNQGDGVHRV